MAGGTGEAMGSKVQTWSLLGIARPIPDFLKQELGRSCAFLKSFTVESGGTLIYV